MSKVKTHQKQILHLETRIAIPQPKPESGSDSIKSMLKSLKDSKLIDIGINAVNRKIIQKKVKILVICADINPPEIIQHILIMAKSAKIPIISTQIPQKEVGKCLGVRSAGVIGISDSIPNETYELLKPFMSLIEQDGLQSVRIETDVFVPKTKK
ncbi:50S ribosomal protein L7Ae [Tritrichomonas foetus]|uniref:50S ribosomal protein L7Ae n=1 Tax=Tritrichomonas foetus TaxID=1144522 RepID=A0A1J4JIX7_9EUKA|nr:50S ribosomal protein L7Ae [Tritrichomonas foetus]|eukprot:OHS98545.1 50S ribosomal protein L7Ae [Tritrichomonas foetus]